MSGHNIHPSSSVGPSVTVSPEARIGPNCYVSGQTTIGARTTLVGGITLIGDASIGEDCLIEPGVTMTTISTSDAACGPLVVGDGVHIGAGCVLALGVMIGSAARIGAGTVLTRNVPAQAIVRGNPAAIVGYSAVPSTPDGPPRAAISTKSATTLGCRVAGVRILQFPRIRDLRGDLSVGEFGRNVPFEPKRFFLVYDVPSAETRGEHAHRACEQFLICVSGSVAVVVDDGRQREEIYLDSPNIGLYIPPMVWGLQYKYSPSTVLLVFASHYYDTLDYIRDYNQFLEMCATAA